MKLFSRDIVTDLSLPSIVVLHGLFGSSKNWLSFSKAISFNYNVYLLDQRNHGDSPHSDTHSMPDMVDDLAEWIQDRNLSHPILLGHSMGGLVSMLYALTQKSKGLPPIEKLIVQDIAPRQYPFNYSNEVESMQIDMSDCKSRQDVDSKMAPLVPDAFIRQFLQMNLERKAPEGYFWKINVEAISASRKMFGDLFTGLNATSIPALFILGGKSPFISSSDPDLIRKFFSNSSIRTIPDGGHYMQYTHAGEFIRIIKEWLVGE